MKRGPKPGTKYGERRKEGDVCLTLPAIPVRTEAERRVATGLADDVNSFLARIEVTVAYPVCVVDADLLARLTRDLQLLEGQLIDGARKFLLNDSD